MISNREAVSRVKNQLRLISKDANLPSRFILFVLQNIAESYLSKKARDRSLYRYSDLYKEVPCVEMENIDISF